MTKEEFVARWADELSGFAVAAFAMEERGDMAAKGRWMIQQLKRARELAGKMFDQLEAARLPTLDSVAADAAKLTPASKAELLKRLVPSDNGKPKEMTKTMAAK